MGLVQRKIEAAGIATISLSPIPVFTASVGAPRVAAIEYPLGQNFGEPGDAVGQTAVLRATLQALTKSQKPGAVIDLPFTWSGAPHSHPDEPPPIVNAIKKRPWLYKRLLDGNIPDPN